MPPSSPLKKGADPLRTSAVPCSWIPYSMKMILAVTVIVLASLISLENWPAIGMLLVIVLIGHCFAEVKIAYLVRRLALFLPMLFVFGLSMPLSQIDNSAAWSWMFAMWMRCTVSFLAGLWLVHVLPFPELLRLLIRWHVPILLVAMLSFMYRYIFILWDEVSRLRHARDARDFGSRSLKMRWFDNTQMIGLLLLRAMERAERTHQAMLARGWDGSIRFLGDGEECSR